MFGSGLTGIDTVLISGMRSQGAGSAIAIFY